MKRTRVSIPVLALAFALAVLGTSCAKEEVIAPSTEATGTLKSTGTPDPTFSNDGNDGVIDPKVDPNGISDDGDDQGDRERGRGKRIR